MTLQALLPWVFPAFVNSEGGVGVAAYVVTVTSVLCFMLWRHHTTINIINTTNYNELQVKYLVQILRRNLRTEESGFYVSVFSFYFVAVSLLANWQCVARYPEQNFLQNLLHSWEPIKVMITVKKLALDVGQIGCFFNIFSVEYRCNTRLFCRKKYYKKMKTREQQKLWGRNQLSPLIPSVNLYQIFYLWLAASL
jgi:hypothetical protein